MKFEGRGEGYFTRVSCIVVLKFGGRVAFWVPRVEVRYLLGSNYYFPVKEDLLMSSANQELSSKVMKSQK